MNQSDTEIIVRWLTEYHAYNNIFILNITDDPNYVKTGHYQSILENRRKNFQSFLKNTRTYWENITISVDEVETILSNPSFVLKLAIYNYDALKQMLAHKPELTKKVEEIWKQLAKSS